ncbi:MAG: CDP-alcohol phosphatidyltransferase family protein [Actinobacteria bacterium]|nr:CDP-alcohol phosphatidyltransferase family protein [Actinomycetota bacterium]
MTFNIPNALTFSRLLFIPVFLYALFARDFEARWLAPLAFGLAALTDCFDGYFARRLNQETEFGKLADPAIDRIFVAVAAVAVYLKFQAVIPAWVVLVIVGRDALMSLGWMVLSRYGVKLRVSMLGKTATGFLMSALFILLADVELNMRVVRSAGLLALYVGAALSVISGYVYLKMGISTLRSKQAN